MKNKFILILSFSLIFISCEKEKKTPEKKEVVITQKSTNSEIKKLKKREKVITETKTNSDNEESLRNVNRHEDFAKKVLNDRF